CMTSDILGFAGSVPIRPATERGGRGVGPVPVTPSSDRYRPVRAPRAVPAAGTQRTGCRDRAPSRTAPRGGVRGRGVGQSRVPARCVLLMALLLTTLCGGGDHAVRARSL